MTDRWAAALGIVHRSEMFAAADNGVTLPEFTRVDGGIFFDVNARLRAQVNVENLTDETPPLYTAAVQMNTDPSTFDVLGRRYFLRANVKF